MDVSFDGQRLGRTAAETLYGLFHHPDPAWVNLPMPEEYRGSGAVFTAYVSPQINIDITLHDGKEVFFNRRGTRRP